MTDDPAYFLYHSIGLYPGKAEEMAHALGAFAQTWGAVDDAQWPTVLGAREEFIDLWRARIGAPQGTLSSAENVTVALFSILGGLPPERLRGKKVLVAADCFPSLHFLLNGMQERLGYTLETVPIRQGDFWVRDEAMIAAWDENVGLALLTFVTSTSSHRCDLDGLIAHGHRMGSLVGVDLTQGVGIVPFSLNATPADFVISTTLKWLCGTPGAGILQMHAGLIDEVKPELRGWFSQDNPFSWDLDAFDYAPDARRFEHGTPSVMACVGSVPALRWHAGQGGLIEHNRALTSAVIERAGEAGMVLASPADALQRGGSVMLQLTEDVDAGALVDGLRERGVYVDCRGRILRVSPGAVTTRDHVDRLFEGLRKILVLTAC
jgi:kynureninase